MLRLRLILSFALIVLVSVASVVIIARQGVAGAVRTFMFGGGMTGTEGLVSALEDYYIARGSWEGVQDLLDNPAQWRGHGMGGWGMHAGEIGGMMSQRLRLADAHGNLVADSLGNAPLNIPLTEENLQGAIVLEIDRQVVGYLLPEGGMAFSSQDEVRLVSRITRAALIAAAIAGGVSLLLALGLAYGLIRPIRALTFAADQMARGDLGQRVAVRGADELARLGGAFNRMAENLQRAEQSRQAMTADIAHELRNPLAVQRANLEALQDGIYPLTPENLAPILEQNVLLGRLVDDLRTLALADSGQLKLETVPTDLEALVGSVIEQFAAQAGAHSVTLHFQKSPAPLSPLIADPLRIQQILGNLLSNALRYVPDQGRIEITTSQNSSAIQLTLRDNGAGIAPEALPYIFERFYRVDKARSRMEGGSGLGLAIARQLAQAHNGDLTAANHPEGGAVFTLTLPKEH